MRRSLASLSLLGLLAAVPALAGPSQWVDPFIGTAGGGNTFPGAVLPWGMVSVSPHNDLKAPSGYIHGRPLLYGFGHVHLSGTGCADLGSLVLMPTTGDILLDKEKRASPYGGEVAWPGYYKVDLKAYDVQAQMTATLRAGLSLYTFPARKGDANILLDAGSRLTGDPADLKTSFESRVRIISPQEIEGYSQSGDFCSVYAGNKQTVYFSVLFSKPAQGWGTWKEGRLSDEKQVSGKDVGAFFRFSTASGEPIAVKAGISYVSIENARQNLQAELPGWDFHQTALEARGAWDGELSRIELKGVLPDRLKIFTTALYHALLHPCIFSDVNGEYQALGHRGVRNEKDLGYTRYHVFSLWDTYRALHPFLGLFYPERQLDMARSLVEMGKEAGRLPKWELAGNETGVMVGAPAVPVLLDSWRQGLKRFDTESGFSAAQATLDPKDNKVYGGLKSLVRFGYIPKNDDSGDYLWGSVSTGLEYGYSYWCLAQWAKDLKDPKSYEKYIHLSGVYRNYFDPVTGFLRPRNRDGSWTEPFDPQARCCDQGWPDNGGPGFVEGSAWQYLFAVPHDLEGLQMLMGGEEAFVEKLRALFEGGHYDPGNEPDMAFPYLFDEVKGEAWRTQERVRAIMDKYYGTGPDGLPGNDDTGSLSAWYLFSALGFYPVCPGSNLYQMGSPIYQQALIHLNKEIYPGGLLTLKTVDNSMTHPYVQSVLVDGYQQKKPLFTHDDLVYGKTILFRMGGKPKK